MARYNARRPQNNSRNPLPIVTIACDDTKTAIAYFNELKKEVKQRRTIHIIPASHHGADGHSVVEHAASQRPESMEPEDVVWALIDLDTNPNVGSLREQAKRAGVQLAVSAPCFEVWTLAHLEDTGEGFIDCSAVLARVKTTWKTVTGIEFPSKKAQADYSKIIPMRPDAIARCRKRSELNSQSWTEVWKIVEAILA